MLYKFTLLLLSSLLVLNLSFAQQKGNSDIRNIKIAMLSDYMDMTPEQSQKFWPLYNRYENELRVIWRQKKAIRENSKHSKNPKQDLDRMQQLDGRQLAIKAKYKDEFLKVISARQLTSMNAAEAEFKKILIERWKKE